MRSELELGRRCLEAQLHRVTWDAFRNQASWDAFRNRVRWDALRNRVRWDALTNRVRWDAFRNRVRWDAYRNRMRWDVLMSLGSIVACLEGPSVCVWCQQLLCSAWYGNSCILLTYFNPCGNAGSNRCQKQTRTLSEFLCSSRQSGSGLSQSSCAPRG